MANFTKEQIQQVWEKGLTVDGYDKNKYRQDFCGAWIQRDQYGKETTYGWEIDHVYPSSKGGTDDLKNLRPMQWENNRSKGDDYPEYTCAITSMDNKNVSTDIGKTVNQDLQSVLKGKFKIK